MGNCLTPCALFFSFVSFLFFCDKKTKLIKDNEHLRRTGDLGGYNFLGKTYTEGSTQSDRESSCLVHVSLLIFVLFYTWYLNRFVFFQFIIFSFLLFACAALQEAPEPSPVAAAEAESAATPTDLDNSVYIDSIILENGSSIYGGGDGRSTRKVIKEAFLHFMRQDHVVGKVARSLVSDVIGMRAHADEMERSKTTVTATSDVSRYFLGRCAAEAM